MTAYFEQRDQTHEKGKIETRYQFNMISPKSFNGNFQKLPDGDARGYHLDLDVSMTTATKTAE